MYIPPERFATASIHTSAWGDKICQVLSAVISHCDAGTFIRDHVANINNKLIIQQKQFDLAAFDRIFLIGAGKAVVPMAGAISRLLENRISNGLVITKDGYLDHSSALDLSKIKVLEAAHPVPDRRSISATGELLSLVSQVNRRDLVICLISGGGSSLLTAPAKGLTLLDIQQTATLLLKSGAAIDEVNIIRKHMDDVKGGGLARRLYPATVISLILSDVIGDLPEMVASGPTFPDSSTYEDAKAILIKYQIFNQLPINVRSHFTAGIEGMIPETIKPDDPEIQAIQNFVVGSNAMAISAAVQVANDSGFTPVLLPMVLSGEASLMGKSIVDHIKSRVSINSNNSPLCFIAGGETTVTVSGYGKGGRNQELVLGAVASLSGTDDILIISLATDGGDGPTDAAGAVATNQTLTRGMSLGLNPADYLTNNDSYLYFDLLGDLIKIGPTLTNINDLVFLFCR